MDTVVTLTNNPTDKELEEYISSYFQAAGYYIERNIIEREVTEVLELDIIASNYSNSIPETILIEIKSGKWGFPDIFKVKGWLEYLKLNKAAFIVDKSKDDKNDYYIKKSKRIGVNLKIILDLDNCKDDLNDLLNNKKVTHREISSWRFSYWIERNIIKELIHKKKSLKNVSRYSVLTNYYHEVNNGIFFTKNILDRLIKLFNLFFENPHITSKVGNEIDNGKFDGEKLPNSIFRKNYYECKHTDINISTYIEHRSRLAILKNVVDYILYSKVDPKHKKIDEYHNILGLNRSKFNDLPQFFRDRIEEISTHKYFHLYPIFWEWFMWFMGGFILLDYKEKEYKFLSNKTGIPVSEIDNAFKAYDILFPHQNGWFKKIHTSNIKFIKMFSVVFMGIGVGFRLKKYTIDCDINKLELTGLYTIDDLIRWNNCAVEYLNK